MRVFDLFLSELIYRKGGFVLALLAIVAAAACLLGTKAFLAAHDRETSQLIRALEDRSIDRMAGLRDEARKFSKSLGFNTLILPRGQSLSEFYAQGRSHAFFSRDDIEELKRAQLETLNHLRPILRKKMHWDEYGQEVIVLGVEGEVYIKAPKWQKPIEEAVEPGTIQLGHALAEERSLSKGARVAIKGKAYNVTRILRERGNEQDISIRMNLADAQRLLRLPGKISGVLALSCTCGALDPAAIRKEIAGVLPAAQLVDFTVRGQARLHARRAIGKGTKAEIEDIRSSRHALREQTVRFTRILQLLVSAGTVVMLVVLGANNGRERRTEVAMLKVMGVQSQSILRLFLYKAILAGAVGASMGCLVALAASRWVYGESGNISPGYVTLVFLGTVMAAVSATLAPALLASRSEPPKILNQE